MPHLTLSLNTLIAKKSSRDDVAQRGGQSQTHYKAKCGSIATEYYAQPNVKDRPWVLGKCSYAFLNQSSRLTDRIFARITDTNQATSAFVEAKTFD